MKKILCSFKNKIMHSRLILGLLMLSLSGFSNVYSQTWSSFGGADDWVYASVVYNGDLIVGGKFTSIGGVYANHIGRWNGSTWSPLGLGVNGKVNALIVHNGLLYVGGEFTVAGGIPMNFIAIWDGSQWLNDLGDMGSIVTSFAIYNNRLIVGGYFTDADGVPLNYITQYTNGGWAPLGTGVVGTQGQVMALEVYNNELIAAGFFTAAGGVSANHIAKWNGTSWSPLGSGISNIVYSLTNYNGNLIAGGLFLSAGGAPANHIASWNGSSWSPLGGGMSGTFYQYVFALKAYNGHLIAGGYFTHSDGIQTNGIAEWDGSAWSPLGSGLFYPGNVYGAHTFCLYGQDLIVGGLFSNMGPHLAKWNSPPNTLTLSVTGTNTTCGGNNGTIDLTAVGGAAPYTYNWSNGAHTEDLSGLATGTYTVTVNDATAASATTSYTVSTSNAPPVPATPGTIAGISKICPGSTYTYTIAPVTNATTYNWTAPANASIITGQGTTEVSIQFNPAFTSGNVSVVASNCAGSSGAKTLAISLVAVPGTPGIITGPKPVCPGTSYAYYIGDVLNATSYTWTAPANASIVDGQGTTIVTVMFGQGYTTGSLSVTASNCRGTSAPRVLSIPLMTKPAKPGIISGSTIVCEGIYLYSIAPVAYADSYTWVAPANASITGGQGTTTVEVTYTAGFTSGNVSVAANNCGGTSLARTLAVTKTPPAPSAISGPLNNICGSTTGIIYTATAIPEAVSFTWVVTGGTIVAGQGTSAITVNFPATFTSATIKVKANTACASSGYKTVKVIQAPAAPASIAGSLSVCPGQNYQYTAAEVPGISTYTWTVPAGWTIVSGQGTSMLLVTAGTSAGALQVVANNACAASAVKKLTVSLSTGCLLPQLLSTSDENYHDFGMALYPNPADGSEVNLELEGIGENAECRIYDLLGQEVTPAWKIYSGINAIDIQSFKSGLYVVEVKDGDTIKMVRLMIR